MDYRITGNLIDITDALKEFLRGNTKVAIEYPFEGQPDKTIRLVPKDEEL